MLLCPTYRGKSESEAGPNAGGVSQSVVTWLAGPKRRCKECQAEPMPLTASRPTAKLLASGLRGRSQRTAGEAIDPQVHLPIVTEIGLQACFSGVSTVSGRPCCGVTSPREVTTARLPAHGRSQPVTVNLRSEVK